MPETSAEATSRDTLADFAAAVGQPFELLAGEATELLTLAEAAPSGPPHGPAARAPFALLFRSASQVVLPQGTWRMRNATLGMLDIFLVPVARDAEGVSYQAIFG